MSNEYHWTPPVPAFPELPPSRNRFDDAVEIQEGACNVIAIANALVRACREIQTGGYEQDPAVRMIVHQLAHLTDHYSIENGIDGGESEWQRLIDYCTVNSLKYREKE